MAISNPRTLFIQKGWQRAVIFCVAYILATYVVGLIAGGALGLVAVSKGATSVSVETMNTISLLAIAIVSVALSIVFRLYIDRQPVSSLGFHSEQHRNDTWVGLLLAMVLMGAGSLILHIAGNLNWTDARFRGSDFFIAIVLMLIVAVSEEMVFRGYLLNNLMESFDKRVALLLSALIFTIAHSLNPGLNALAVINLFLGGLLLGINFMYTKTLWFAIGFHFGWNLLQGYVLGFAVSGFSEQTLLQQELKGHPVMTGNQFGFEGSIVATVVLAAAVGVFYFLYEKKFAEAKQAI